MAESSGPSPAIHKLPGNIPPTSVLTNEATALVVADGGGVADTRTRNELNLRGIISGDARVNDAQAEPLLIFIEWNTGGARAAVPG